MKREATNKLFGTDGIRGSVGKFPLDMSSLNRLSQVLARRFSGSRLLTGRDTRISGKEIEAVLTAGFSSGSDIYSAGIITTPGLSFLTREGSFDCGIMITASHNPFHDNGIKIFSSRGEKISDQLEEEIESSFFSLKTDAVLQNQKTARPVGNLDTYGKFLLSHAEGIKTGSTKLLLDCANGSTYKLAPGIFSELGYDVVSKYNQPDGKNINHNCGSTATDNLGNLVREEEADLGIAFDGDGDRVLMVDREGTLLDGDDFLYLISRYLTADAFPQFNHTVVGTVMTNLGLELELKRLGIDLLRAPVGDRFVYQKMKETGSILGGEQSGHIILGHLNPTGDGILSAIYVLKALDRLSLQPTGIKGLWARYPQELLSIRIRYRKDLATWPEYQDLLEEFTLKHGDQARPVIRYSGTEPLLRVMIEARDREVIDDYMDRFRYLIQKEIGEE